MIGDGSWWGSAVAITSILVSYTVFFFSVGHLPVTLVGVGMLSLGVVASINAGLVTAYLHDVYGSRVKTALQLNALVASMAMIVSPVISVAYTITFGVAYSILTGLFLGFLGLIIQVYSLRRSRARHVIPSKSGSRSGVIGTGFYVIRRAFCIPVERRLMLVLFAVNMAMTPFFMVVFPFLADRDYYSFEQAIAVFDFLFALGFILSTKYVFKRVSRAISRRGQVLLGLILLALMLNFSLMVDSIVVICALCFCGGVGLPLVVINVSSFRIGNCPPEVKSQVFATLVFFSLAGNPLGIYLVTVMLSETSLAWVVVYNSSLTLLAICAFVAGRSVLDDLNGSPGSLKTAYAEAFSRR